MDGISDGWSTKGNFIYREGKEDLANRIEVTRRRGDAAEFTPTDPKTTEVIMQILRGAPQEKTDRDYASQLGEKRAKLLSGQSIEIFYNAHIYKITPVKIIMNDQKEVMPRDASPEETPPPLPPLPPPPLPPLPPEKT